MEWEWIEESGSWRMTANGFNVRLYRSRGERPLWMMSARPVLQDEAVGRMPAERAQAAAIFMLSAALRKAAEQFAQRA